VSATRRAGCEHEVEQPHVDRVVAGAAALERVVTLAQVRAHRLIVAGDRRPCGGHHGGGESGVGPFGRRPHPAGEQFLEQHGQSERAKVGRPPRTGQWAGGVRGNADRTRGCGRDGVALGEPLHDPALGVAAGEPGEAIGEGRGHDADERRVIRGRQIDARPVGWPADGGDEAGLPCRGPRRKQVVGLDLVEPRREVVERVAGKKDRKPLDRHGPEYTAQRRPTPVPHGIAHGAAAV
jgi:hypothetical protein